MAVSKRKSEVRQGSVASQTADAQLAKMGYQSELPRNLSMFSVLGLYVIVDVTDLSGMNPWLMRCLDRLPSWQYRLVCQQRCISRSQMANPSLSFTDGFGSAWSLLPLRPRWLRYVPCILLLVV